MLEYEARIRRYEPTPEDRAWLLRRLAYYFAHLLVFSLIVYRIGPNLFLFHSPFSPSPAYYATLTRPYVSMVAAIKAYKRDTGSLPSGTDDLPKEYVPADYIGEIGEILGTGIITFGTGDRHSIVVVAYDFRPATEGWFIYAPRYYGPIPAPKVQPAPTPPTPPGAFRVSPAPTGNNNAGN